MVCILELSPQGFKLTPLLSELLVYQVGAEFSILVLVECRGILSVRRTRRWRCLQAKADTQEAVNSKNQATQRKETGRGTAPK